MERRRIKIEIPLPSKPTWRLLRFSLKSIMLLIACLAIAFAIHNYATDLERSKHGGGRYHVVVSTPYEFIHKSFRDRDHSKLHSLLTSGRLNVDTWPATIWIKRPDFAASELETRIDITCGGTPDDPTFTPDVDVKWGDVIYIDTGRLVPRTATVPQLKHGG